MRRARHRNGAELEGEAHRDSVERERKRLRQIRLIRFTLVIGEEEGFAAKGAMINFYPEQNSMKFEINARQISFHEHNEATAGPRILGFLAQGKSIAVVTNAGTPGISDPGFTLVRRAIQADVPVTMSTTISPIPRRFTSALNCRHCNASLQLKQDVLRPKNP